MNKLSKINTMIVKFGGMFASFALIVGVMTTSIGCLIVFHQPKVPQGMNKYIKNR